MCSMDIGEACDLTITLNAEDSKIVFEKGSYLHAESLFIIS